MKTETLLLPETWASVLINGDSSGTTTEELAQINEWRADYPHLGEALCCSDSSETTRYHDAPSSVGMASCLEFTFPVIERGAA